MTDALTVEQVAKALEGLGVPESVRSNRIRVPVPLERIRDALARAASALACDHLVQIAAVDGGTSFALHYHLTGAHRTVLTLVVEIPREKAKAPTVSDLLPPAGIYERQIHDLFGIVFEGHPNLKRIILNEDWPEDEFPLRKDWKPDPSHFYGGAPPEVS